MPQSLAQIYLHMIFSTKNREPWLEEELQPGLHAYMAGTSKRLDAPVLKVGGVEDHIHCLLRFPRTLTVAQWVEKVKSSSSSWVNERGSSPNTLKFAWQAGYGAFSVSPSHVKAVSVYIETQKEHHRTVTFQEEYRKFLKKYGITFDERYVWD